MKKKLQTLLKALLSDKRILIASICILSSISIFISGALYAKYVHNRDADIVASSPNFYFESDYLTATGAEYTLGSDVTSVVFALRNYADEFRFSDDDINFSLTVECLTDPSDTSATLSQNAGKIDKGAANEAPITLSNLKSGYSYRVVAIGESGFRQTLQATFTVQATEQKLYKYLESTNEYVILTVWTRDLEGDVAITFPEGLTPDNTLSGMASVQNTPKTFEVAYPKYTSHNYRFFKKDLGDDFTANDFTVMLGEIEAEIKTLS